MLPKPDTCRGCPFYGTGRGFVPDELRPVPVLVLGQAPGSHEEAGERLVARAGKVKRWEPAAPAPFLGDAGYDLGRTYLPLAGLTRDDVSLCSVVRCRVGHGGPLPPLTHTAVRQAIQHCQQRHFSIDKTRISALQITTECTCGHRPERHSLVSRLAGGRGLFHLGETQHTGMGTTDGQRMLDRQGCDEQGSEHSRGQSDGAESTEKSEVEANVASARDRLSGGGLDDDPLPADGAAPQGEDSRSVETLASGPSGEGPRGACVECECATYSRRPATASTTDGARVIVTLNKWPLWAATGEDGGDPPPYGISRKVGGWRGWTLPYSPFMRQALPHIWTPNSSTSGVGCVYVSLHPASIYESPWMKPAAMRDWQKLGELLAGRWPRPLPPVERTMARWPDEFAYDTEFYEHAGRQVLTRWSASDGERVWVVEASEPHPPHLNRNYHVVLHQADADVDTLEGTLGPRYSLDDTMYAHAALHAELAHDLDFLGSLYARTNRWKHLVRTNPVVYSAGDALGTWDVWRALRAELARDHDTRRVYETCLLPLLPIVARARRMGIRVEQKRAEASVRALREAQRVLQLGAMAAAGWPLSLSSAKQVTTHLYDVEGL